ncbi:hypothetical protein [Rhizobium sp. Leaf371]|uniref:hypothetical protein n=1 Tax=Rhizobium sp. Leaf371 TaxID=1736355 RepID=UPI00138F1395|nr:hypothetical protein [Rhizobium sp. Leaf371]
MTALNSRPSHSSFIVDLEAFLQKCQYQGSGNAAESGISVNRRVFSYKQPRKLLVYQTGKVDSNWSGPRPKSYLAAYVKTFGPKFSYEKLLFKTGEIWPDLAIMKSALKYECVAPTDGHNFRLTDKGRHLISSLFEVSGE